nr:uncharacterized protein LOC109171487 [Ipomoea batatas]
MAKTLSDDFSEVKKMIEEMKDDSSDLTKLQTAVQNVLHTNNYEAKFYKIEARLDSLEKSVEDINNLTKKIAQRESRMSDSDSQNVSAQDYDDAVETTPTDASSANSVWIGWRVPRGLAALKKCGRSRSGRRLTSTGSPVSRKRRGGDLEPPDYSQSEKYIPKKMSGSSSAVPVADPKRSKVGLISGRGMVLERSFAPATTGPKKPRPKVTLGGSKAPLPVEVATAQETAPSIPTGSTGTVPTTDLQVTRPAARRGKEKAAEPEVEEIQPLKRQKRPAARGSTPVLDALREGGEHTASFIDKVRAVIPTREAIRDLETDQVGEMIAQNVLWVSPPSSLPCLENVVRKDVVPLKESLAAKDKELTEKVKALEARIASAEQGVKGANGRPGDEREDVQLRQSLRVLGPTPRKGRSLLPGVYPKEVGGKAGLALRGVGLRQGPYEMQQAVPGPSNGRLAEPTRTEVRWTCVDSSLAEVFSTSLTPRLAGASGRQRSSRPQAEPYFLGLWQGRAYRPESVIMPCSDLRTVRFLGPMQARSFRPESGLRLARDLRIVLDKRPRSSRSSRHHKHVRPTDLHQQIRLRSDALLLAPPTARGRTVAVDQRRSAAEGTRTPRLPLLPSGSGEGRGTALTGRGKAPALCARTARDEAPGSRGSTGSRGPGRETKMSELPESTLYRIQVDAAKLPVLDDAADLSNNQLNWTNLFLWNKFGKSLSAADAEAAKQILTIKTVDDKTLAQLKNMAKTLSDDFSEVKKMIEEMKDDSSDLTKLQTAVQNVLHTNNYEAKFYKIEARLDSLEKSVEDINNLTKKIAQRFGII